MQLGPGICQLPGGLFDPVIVDGRRLCELDGHTGERNAVFFYDRDIPLCHVPVQHTGSGKIDGDRQKFRPFLHFSSLHAAYLAEHILIQPYDQPVLFINRDKISRRDQRFSVLFPADQCLCPDDTLRGNIHLRLIVDNKFLFFQRGVKTVFDHLDIHAFLCHFFCIICHIAAVVMILHGFQRHRRKITDGGKGQMFVYIFIYTIFDLPLFHGRLFCDLIDNIFHLGHAYLLCPPEQAQEGGSALSSDDSVFLRIIVGGCQITKHLVRFFRSINTL